MPVPSHEGRDADWFPYLERYRRGEWRAPIFRDLVLADVRRLGEQKQRPPRLLDIGCGRGFDDEAALQASLAAAAGEYVGVEPDAQIELAPVFSAVHRCRFEEASIPPSSVDVAFAVMVLEHLASPQSFWDKLHTVLREGGVFWGFTVDARHWFVGASLLFKRLRLATGYLDLLHGKRGEERYENYAVHYRSNTPEQIERLTPAFRSRTFLNLGRVGQLDYYLPAPLRWLSRSVERTTVGRGHPGALLAVRVVK